MPFFSVVLPFYNSQKYIEESLNSILNQTYSDFEVIMIDDFSSDKSPFISQSFCDLDSRFRLISLKKNYGAFFARNVGIEKAKGEYICFCDSDDLWVPKKLEIQKEILTNKKVDVCSGGLQKIDSQGNFIGKPIIFDQNKPNIDSLKKTNSISLSTAAVRACLLKNNNFPNYKIHEDYALWLRLAYKGANFLCINEKLIDYRVHENSISSNKIKSAIAQWNILSAETNDSFLLRVKHFFYYFSQGVIKKFK